MIDADKWYDIQKINRSDIPSLYKKRKHHHNLKLTQLAAMRTTTNFVYSDRYLNRNGRNSHNKDVKLLFDSSEQSIDQLKSKIKEYLNSTRENSPLNYCTESYPQLPQKNKEHFRVSLFKTNMKKKIQLKMMEGVEGQANNQIKKQFNVSQAFINKRKPVSHYEKHIKFQMTFHKDHQKHHHDYDKPWNILNQMTNSTIRRQSQKQQYHMRDMQKRYRSYSNKPIEELQPWKQGEWNQFLDIETWSKIK